MRHEITNTEKMKETTAFTIYLTPRICHLRKKVCELILNKISTPSTENRTDSVEWRPPECQWENGRLIDRLFLLHFN
jgi:hypothetical protein